jgi:S-adenosylmethionine-diacylglycerol 3-amino-3-carboxypropyl transferase
MNLRDVAFQNAFSKLFVYNILFEDAEVDERFLGVEEDSSVLSITGAGCGVAGMVSRRPRTMDAVDINPHHLALSALKVTAAQRLAPYHTFYDLLGHGSVHNPKEVISQIAHYMPRWVQKYWKRHHGRFSQNFYEQGLTAQMVKVLRHFGNIDMAFMRELMAQNPEGRYSMLESVVAPVFERRLIKTIVQSPVQLLSLGVNYEQRNRMLEAEGQEDMIDFILHHFRRLLATELETNWFVWLYVTGQYNHERQDAVPPYLRKDRWERSQHGPSRVRYHNRNIFDVLGDAPRNTWSHYTLCDMPDWLPMPLQRNLLDEILRTSRDGAVVLYRTVEDDCLVERHGMHQHFERMDEVSEQASEQDRSRQYRHVHFYRVSHAC